MAFKVGAVFGEAILKTAKWTSGAALIQKGAQKLGKSLLTLTKVGFAAMSAALIKSTFEANKFQKSFSNVTTLISEQDENFQTISKSLLQLDSRLGKTTELTEGLYQALSAGAEDAAAGIEIVTEAAKFSTAALTTNASAVDILTTAMNAYGKDVVSAANASDIFFTTIKEGKINGQELSSVIGQSIPLFASTGIALEELTSGMAAMTKQGVSASETTTQLNAIVNSFLKPSELMSQALKEQGFESGAAFLKTEGLAGALKLLEEQTDGDATALAELLPNIRAMRGAMALTGRGGVEFTEILGEMKMATGATDIAFEKQEITFATFRNELLKSQVLIGNISKFFVDELAVGATTALNAVNDFLLSTKGMEAFAKVASVVGAVFGLIEESARVISEMVAPALDTAITDIKDAFGDFGESLGDADGKMNLFSSGLRILGKIMIVDIQAIKLTAVAIADLLGVIVSGGQIITAFFKSIAGEGTWDDFQKATDKGGQAVIKMVKNIKENGLEVGKSIKDVGLEIFDTMITADNDVDKTSARITENMKTRSAQVSKFVVSNWDQMVTGVKSSNNSLVTDTKETSDGMAGAVEDGVTRSLTALEKLKEWADTNLSTFADKFKFAFDTISEFAALAFDGAAAISSQFYTNEFAKLENSQSEETTALRDQAAKENDILNQKLADGIITESEFNLQKEILDQTFADKDEALRKKQLAKENELKKEQFESNKKLAIANIWMNLAQAVMGFWAAYASIPVAGPIIAGTLTAGATGLAIAQTALVAQQEFVPARKDGGMASGLTRVNEEGGEIIRLPDQSLVIPNDISKQIASNSGNRSINIHNPIVREKQDITRIAQAVSRVLGRELRTA